MHGVLTALCGRAGGKASLVGPGGGCLRVQGAGYQGGRGGLVLVTCNATDPEQVRGRWMERPCIMEEPVAYMSDVAPAASVSTAKRRA